MIFIGNRPIITGLLLKQFSKNGKIGVESSSYQLCQVFQLTSVNKGKQQLCLNCCFVLLMLPNVESIFTTLCVFFYDMQHFFYISLFVLKFCFSNRIFTRFSLAVVNIECLKSYV